jgi:hypothetical protein
MLGPCPKCRRHVFIASSNCPFCGAVWKALLSAAAAASLLLGAPTHAAPVPDRPAVAQDPVPLYGPAREHDERTVEVPTLWDAVYADWAAKVGIARPGKSWSTRKAGSSATYAIKMSKVGQRPHSAAATYVLSEVAKDAVRLKVSSGGGLAQERNLALLEDVVKDAKVVEEATETLEADGAKFDCVVKSYEMIGRSFKVWWCKDAPGGLVKFTSGEETTTLTKRSETVTVQGRKIECHVWTTVAGGTEAQEWRSDAVPGQLVKRTETVKNPEKPKGEPLRTATIELTGFVEK